MSNSTRRFRRSHKWKDGALPLPLPAPPDEFEIKARSAQDRVLHAEILEAPTQEMMPLEALVACAREARDKGFARGIGVGICIGGALTLAAHVIMVIL